MTAQIAIMNKSAIALASDSAVTITQRADNKSKIYNTANKLFTLSKYAPVGVMIFGSSEFLLTPWETIIKIYRQRLGSKTFGTVGEYAYDFIDFLYKSNDLFPESIRNQELHYVSATILYSILDDIDGSVEKMYRNDETVTEGKIKQIVERVISTNMTYIRSAKLLNHIQKSVPKQILKNHRKDLNSQIKQVFQSLPLGEFQKQKLLWICINYHCRDLFDENHSGVVFAGFGETEVFPSMSAFLFEANYNELIKYKLNSQANISRSNSAGIYPFAQTDMVGEFMEGCHPDQDRFIISYIKKIMEELPQKISGKLQNCTKEEKNRFSDQFSQFSKGLIDSLVEDIEKYRRKEHIDPVIDTVAILPKDELATMAEALVNLTQFRQRMTMEMETVGGPIDVAVISKGDGFVWINRKHYFKPELNQQFMTKYFPDPVDTVNKSKRKAKEII